MSLVQRLVALCCRHALLTIGLSLALTAGAGVYVANNFAMNTDSSQLITAKVAWRMRQAQFDAAFPGSSNLILVVIDGKTPELAEAAAAKLRRGKVGPGTWRAKIIGAAVEYPDVALVGLDRRALYAIGSKRHGAGSGDG